MKLDLLTNAELVNDAAKFVEKHKQQARDNNNINNKGIQNSYTPDNEESESESEQQPTTNEVF
jgi:hypothetical protein